MAAWLAEWLNVSPQQGAAHGHMIDHLSGPLTAGAGVTPCPVDAEGRVAVSWPTREPLLLAAPTHDLDAGALRLTAEVDGAVVASALYARFTAARTFLHLYRPVVNDAGMAAPFALTLTLVQIDAAGVESPVAAEAVAARISVEIVEGMMGRTLVLLGAEKARLRRMAREIQAARRLDDAHDHALDLIGGEVGVPRFADHFELHEGVLVNATVRESDADYRRRLRLYRSWLQPTPRAVDAWLNGAPGPDNRGLLAELGVTQRFRIIEAPNPFAIAITIIGCAGAGGAGGAGGADGGALYDQFFEVLRQVHLVDVSDAPGTDDYHTRRFLSEEQRVRLAELRARLHANYLVPADRGIGVAPALAAALDRYGQALQRLGVGPIQWLRGMDPAGGSRYQLGLGADLAALDAPTLDQMAQAADALRATLVITEASSEVDRILAGATAHAAADDPDGAWLLRACGLRTVHRLDPTRIYVSHFPTFGLVIEPSVPDAHNADVHNADVRAVAPGTAIELAAYYEAPGLPQSNIVLEEGLAAADNAWRAAGESAWTALPDAAGDERLGRVQNDQLTELFAAADLTLTQPAMAAAAALQNAPPELFKVLLLPDDVAERIRAGADDGLGLLRRLVDVLRPHGLISVLPLVTDSGEILLGVGVTALPGAGINIVDRRATGFRWYSVPLHPPADAAQQGKGGAAGTLSVRGSRATYTPQQPGLEAVVALGYARRDGVDPYEFRIEVADDVVLQPVQYEYLMNLLERLCPLGVEVNTYPVRRAHVDFGGDTLGKPLSPKVARTYRKFVRRRFAAQDNSTLDTATR